MLSIESINNSYIKLSSANIVNIIKNISNYEKLLITYGRNCIESSNVTVSIPLDSIQDCYGNSVGVYQYDMSIVKNQSSIVKNVKFKHLITGVELVTSDINLDFSGYSSLCPSGCLLDSLGTTYTQDIRNNIISMLSLNSLDYTNIDMYYCGDILTIVGLPTNIIPTNIEMTNGYKGYFTSNIGSNKIILQDDIFLTPNFFGSSIDDGIYSITINILFSNGNSIKEENCVLVDNSLKCRISEKIEFLLSEDSFEKDMAQELMTIYLGITNGSNCGGCNCKELCDLYNRLIRILSSNTLKNSNTIKIENCHNGCK